MVTVCLSPIQRAVAGLWRSYTRNSRLGRTPKTPIIVLFPASSRPLAVLGTAAVVGGGMYLQIHPNNHICYFLLSHP